MNYELLSDQELVELLELEHEEEIYQRRLSLLDFREGKNKNYSLLAESLAEQNYEVDEDGKLQRVYGVGGVVLEGSSRSGKTWSGIDFIIYLAIHKHAEFGCKIIIVRETYTEFKDTLYDDFKRRLDHYELDNPFHRAKEVKSFKIGKTTITFMGCDKIGKAHGAGSDYVFFNEMMTINQEVFNQLEQRCRIMFWGDYNPSFTQHWVFSSVIKRDDVAFLRTTFLDNPFVSTNEKRKILSYEPWEPGSYVVTPEGSILFNGKEVSDGNQPPPHQRNVDQGTADVFNWKCYGLGIRGAMKGVIFPNVTWITEFPWHVDHTYCTDFGFTHDPCVVNRYAEDDIPNTPYIDDDGNDAFAFEGNIYVEPLLYKPIPTASELDAAMIAVGVDPLVPNIADSSDKYMSEKHGAVQMVLELYDMGWDISKVSKTQNNVYWLTSMKRKKIHIVQNHLHKEVSTEQQNYIWKEVNGMPINQPIDDFNHFWDATKYGHISHQFNPGDASHS